MACEGMGYLLGILRLCSSNIHCRVRAVIHCSVVLLRRRRRGLFRRPVVQLRGPVSESIVVLELELVLVLGCDVIHLCPRVTA